MRMKEARISFEDPQATLTFPVLPSGRRGQSSEIYFAGVRPCPADQDRFHGVSFPHTGSCLTFHTQFAANRWSHVPVAVLKALEPGGFETELRRVYAETGIQIQKDRTEKFKWGTVNYWSTQTMGSAHYLELIPRHRGLSVRIGPIAGLVLADYNLGFKNARWTFPAAGSTRMKNR